MAESKPKLDVWMYDQTRGRHPTTAFRWCSRPHGATSNRQSVEQGSVDANCHGPVGKPTKESWGTLILEGRQWSAGCRLISARDLGYYLSYPSSQKTANEKERLDSSTVESLLLSLENSGDESEAGITTLCQTMHEAGKEGEVINVAYAAHEKLLEDYITPELQAMVILVAVQP